MDKINATVKLNKQDWETLKKKAESLGMNRTKLLTLIARGQVTVNQVTLKGEEKLLREFSQLTKDTEDQLVFSKKQISYYENQVKSLEKKLRYLRGLEVLHEEE